MDRLKFTSIAHTDHVFCSPLSGEKADRVIELLDLPPGARVLDAGCGKGEMLMRVVERYDATGVGVDSSTAIMSEARQRVQTTMKPGAVELLEMDIAEFHAEPASFDLAMCIGAAQLYEDFRGALQALKVLVRPGGLILMGEGYWKLEPNLEYLMALSAGRDSYSTHAGTVAIGVEEGLVPLYMTVSNEDEWDHYESLYMRGIERYAATHPEDTDVPAMLLRVRTWRDVYLRWGRDTLGFGLYLFRR